MFGLKNETIDAIKNVFLKYPHVKKAVIFGSRAKGNYRNGSDIDIALFGNELKMEVLSRLEQDIDDLSLPYTFDFVSITQIDNVQLIDHINRIGKVFYEV